MTSTYIGEVYAPIEKRLATVLAVAIARCLIATCSNKIYPEIPEGHVHHEYTTDFENGCDALWRLDVARAVAVDKRGELTIDAYSKNPPGGVWSGYFRLLNE